MIMKNQLLNLKMIALMCLMMVLGGVNVWAQETVTIWSEDWTGQKDGATPSSINSMYSQGNSKTRVLSDELAGGVAPELLLQEKDKWTINISDLKGCSGELTLSFHTNKNPQEKNPISLTANGNSIKLSVDESDNKLCLGKYSLIKGASNVKIVFYAPKNARIDDVVLTGIIAQTKTLTSLAISGEPTKKIYDLGEALDPTGLVVTGTYDDKSTATIKDGITWAMNPKTLSLSDVACSVTATVDGVTSPAYNVTGLTVNKAKLPATITLTGNATTLGIDDESNTFTVGYDGDGTLSATASAEGVVDLALVGNTVTVTPKAVGSVDITVAATEGTEYKAASKTYTVNVVPVGIAAIRKSITSKSSSNKDAFTAVKLKDAVVTYSGKTSASADKNTIYVEDKTAGVVFYVDGLNYEAGDVLNGTISGEGFVYQGLTEVTSIDASSNIVVTKNGVIPCQEVTVDELNKNMDKWESRRVKLLDVTVASAMNRRNAEISQDGKTIAVFEKKQNCSGDLLSKVNTKIASIVCYPQDRTVSSNSTNQLCIWEESDIVVATADPTYTAQTLKLIAKDDESYYATFSSDKVTFFPIDQAMPYAITVANGKITDKSNMFEPKEASAGRISGYYIPANTGIMLYSTASNVNYYTVENYTVDALAEGANMLMPAPVAGGEFTAETGKVYYKLAYGDWTNKTQLGFYWGADNGGAFYVKAGTAYLAVPKAKAAGAKGFTLNGEATGIEGVNANVENAKAIYNLNGQRVASMAKPGLYIVNGKKVVRK